ncbi:MAG: AsmA family protein [Parvibaculum sp.]|nr:AsmA family protein [Parvibaculum sp.]
MSRLLAILVGIIVLLVAVIVAVPLLIPTSVYKQQVVNLVKTQTGRDLVIGGDVGLSFFPRLAVKVENVDLSNAPWAKDKSMASMKELRAAIKILPLFTGNVEIDSFILVDPIIHLEVKADGTPNWQFSEGKAPAATPADASSGPATVKDIRLGEISVKNGTGTYRNAQSGAALAFEAVNLDISLPGLDDPFGAEGSVTWNSEPVTFSLAAAKPRALTDGGPTPVEFSLSSSKINVTYKGSFQAFDTVKFTGGLDLDVPSIRDLAAWVGSPMPRGNGFGPLKVHGEVFGSGNSYSFNNARVSIDGMNATGKVSVVTGGARPVVKGNLAIDKIDANIYLAADGSAAPAPTTSAAPAPAPAGQTGWSNEPINFSGLKAVDAQIALSTEQLLVKEIKVGPSALNLSLTNGLLNVNLNKLALYDGAGSGTLTLNGASSTPQLQAAFKIAGVKAEPLLTDAADFKRLSGLTAMNFSVSATGRSQREMVGTLGGQGDVKFTNGSVKGINLGALLRNVLSAPATGWTSGGSQDTDFSEMGGTFTIAQGILTNKDLKLLSPLLRVAGSGTVNIPQQTLNYRIEPKLAATLQGQGGSDAQGIEVPVIVEGPWSKPTFRPDLAAMLRDKDKTIETIKSIKEDGGKGLLDSLMGKPATPPADGSTPPPAEKQKPEDLLKGLFGQ